MLIATTYGLILPSSYFWPALPSIAWTLYGNTHVPLQRTTDLLNATLALDGYSLLERRESLTGYISVLENNVDHYRVMRCDHSLLGGEWILPPDPKRKVAEPVYAVFTMLESVRLVQREASDAVAQEQALNIGAGVGTAPSALIAHGINTTIIELDPIILQLLQHFWCSNILASQKISKWLAILYSFSSYSSMNLKGSFLTELAVNGSQSLSGNWVR